VPADIFFFPPPAPRYVSFLRLPRHQRQMPPPWVCLEYNVTPSHCFIDAAARSTYKLAPPEQKCLYAIIAAALMTPRQRAIRRLSLNREDIQQARVAHVADITASFSPRPLLFCAVRWRRAGSFDRGVRFVYLLMFAMSRGGAFFYYIR